MKHFCYRKMSFQRNLHLGWKRFSLQIQLGRAPVAGGLLHHHTRPSKNRFGWSDQGQQPRSGLLPPFFNARAVNGSTGKAVKSWAAALLCAGPPKSAGSFFSLVPMPTHLHAQSFAGAHCTGLAFGSAAHGSSRRESAGNKSARLQHQGKAAPQHPPVPGAQGIFVAGMMKCYRHQPPFLNC